MELSGRGVFLTGGAQGIGRAMTTALLERGARVVFCDVNAEVGRATETELQKEYGAANVMFSQCDITNADQFKEVFNAAISRLGAVEICCNNAGIMDERIWEKMIAINTMAQIRGSQLALEHMRRDQGGRGGVIVNTVSMAGLMPLYNFPAYVASKHAMIGYTTSCAQDPEMGAKGVRWCCLCPYAVNTSMLMFKGGEVYKPEEVLALAKSGMLETEDVVKAFLQLLQDVDNNGKLMVVNKDKGGQYRRRLLVDDDGQSNPMVVDRPLTNHPAVPSSAL